MEPELDQILENASSEMQKAIDHLIDEMGKLRAGKAAPQMVDGVTVDYYGYTTPLNQLASVNTPDSKTLTIQPWEKSMIEPIEKAIQKANLGLNPQNDGNMIRINIPALTEERRKELVKYIKNEAEQAKISIRNIRQDVKDKIKKLQKEGLSEDEAKAAEDKLQKLTDKSIEEVTQVLDKKEEELMTI